MSSSTRSIPSVMDLTDKRVLVTGAASGIGRAAAQCLAELGADLVLADIGSLDAVKADVEGLAGSVEVIQGDLRDDAYCDRLLSAGPYFAFANVAGVFSGRPGDDDNDAFDFVLHVNLRAPAKLASAIAADMAERGGGHIVLVGSAAGRNGGASDTNSLTYAAYAASKGGVHTLVRWLSRRVVGKGVMVNGVAPGVVRTPLFETISRNGMVFNEKALPIGRLADPRELGWPIALMCTPAASYVSGAILDVNGGTYLG